MNKKEIIEMVGKLLNFADDSTPEVAKEENMDDIKYIEVLDVDGVLYVTPAEKYDVGVEIWKMSPEGEKSPANGNIKLKDGTVIVAVDGKVTEIKPAETPVEEVADIKEEMNQNFSSELKLRDDKLNKLEEQFSKVIEAVTVLNEAFSKLPISDKISLSGTISSDTFSSNKPLNKQEKNFKEIASVMEEIKKEREKNKK